MINIRYSDQFKRRYKQRISRDEKLKKDVAEAIETFQLERKSQTINDHQLNRKLYQFRSFSVTNDCRIIYVENQGHCLFLDIGTHDQVYLKRKSS